MNNRKSYVPMWLVSLEVAYFVAIVAVPFIYMNFIILHRYVPRHIGIVDVSYFWWCALGGTWW